MSINEKMTAIADAIREKTGDSEKLTLDGMATAISGISTGGADLPEEAFNVTGNCMYRFSYDGWNWFIDNYGSRIKTSDISNPSSMFFYSSNLENIPFDINIGKATYIDFEYMFNYCQNLKSIPKINNKPSVRETDNMFNYCQRLRYLPEDIADWFSWSYLEAQTTSYSGSRSNMFSWCSSLRSIPMDFLSHANPMSNYSYTYLNYGFQNCYTLDELVALPLPYTATYTSNIFNRTFDYCNRLKNITFEMPDGQPYVMNWKSQTIDLTSYIGYANTFNNITIYNSGITADKQVKDDATYQALKNDVDWFTINIDYSRYNHDSAVATINSLPDTSAYLASAGGTNTIKFKGAAGSATDGGAINTLTEEEIAVATAKGWTVSLV